jgi:tetratricopeptide (TPR) repeat protein
MKRLFPFVFLIVIFGFKNRGLAQAVATTHNSAAVDSATRVKQIQKNIELLTLVIKQTKKPGANAMALAGVYMMRGMDEASLQQLNKALEDFSVAVKLNPDLKEAYWNRGLSYEKVKNYSLAISDYQKALLLGNNTSVQSAILNNNIAIIQKKLKDYDKAIASDSIAIAFEPRYTQSYINRAEVYLLTRKYETAINDFTIALNGNYDKPTLSKIVSERADAKRFLKEYKNAVNDYSLAIELDPNNKLAYWNRAASYNNNGDYELANNDYTKAINYFKGQDKALSRLYDDRALMEIAQQQYKKAIADDSIAIALDNKFAVAYWNKADAYAQNGDYQLSIDGYIKTMDFYKDNKQALAQLYENIGNGEYFLNDYQKVIDACNSSIALNGKARGSYLNRGRAYLKMMNKDIALNDFNKILALDTTKSSYEYAFALFYTGKPDKAIEVMQNNVISTTNNAVLMSHYYNLACLFSLMNKPDEANIYLKKCIDAGYSKKYALTDPDLENIRDTQEYKDAVR